MSVVLSNRSRVVSVNRKSTSPAFDDLMVGDELEFKVELASVGRGYKGTYAAYIECVNQRTQAKTVMSFNQSDKILACCLLQEIKD